MIYVVRSMLISCHYTFTAHPMHYIFKLSIRVYAQVEAFSDQLAIDFY